MDNFVSRYTSKDADKYGADILKGLEELNKKKKSQINYIFEEEVKKLTDAVYSNRANLNWEDLKFLEELANKIYKTR